MSRREMKMGVAVTMPLLRGIWAPVVIALALLALAIVPATGVELTLEDSTGLVEGSDDDIFIASDEVRITEDVEGDIIALGGEVDLDADVNGNVFVAAADISITNGINGDLIALGAEIDIAARISDDVSAAGGDITIHEEAVIGGDVRLAAAEIYVDGYIGGKLNAAAGEITLAGTIDGDVRLHAMSITVASSAVINGDLTYEGPFEAEIDPGAQISGDVTFIQSEGPGRMKGHALAFAGASGIAFVLGIWLTGVALVLLFPGFMANAAGAIAGKPGKSLGLGVVTVFCVPWIILIFAITVIGLPISILLGMAFAAVWLFGFAALGLAVGDKIFRLLGRRPAAASKGRLVWALIVGVTVSCIIAVMPVIGTLAIILATLAGMGAVVSTGYAAHRGSPASD